MTRAHLLGLLALNNNVDISRGCCYFIALNDKFKARIYINKVHLSYRNELKHPLELILSFQKAFKLLQIDGLIK